MSHGTCKTVRVQSWSKDQGDFVEINEKDYDPKRHKLFEAKAPTMPPPPAAAVGKGKGKKNPPPAVFNFASDEARELAKESALTDEQIGEIVGTGENGAISVEDVEKFVEGTE